MPDTAAEAADVIATGAAAVKVKLEAAGIVTPAGDTAVVVSAAGSETADDVIITGEDGGVTDAGALSILSPKE